jgi:hypothetical protein
MQNAKRAIALPAPIERKRSGNSDRLAALKCSQSLRPSEGLPQG